MLLCVLPIALRNSITRGFRQHMILKAARTADSTVIQHEAGERISARGTSKGRGRSMRGKRQGKGAYAELSDASAVGTILSAADRLESDDELDGVDDFVCRLSGSQVGVAWEDG